MLILSPAYTTIHYICSPLIGEIRCSYPERQCVRFMQSVIYHCDDLEENSRQMSGLTVDRRQTLQVKLVVARRLIPLSRLISNQLNLTVVNVADSTVQLGRVQSTIRHR